MSTTIECPHCQNPIAIKDPRPGRFRIKCPRCDTPFALLVPDGPGGLPVVEPARAVEPARVVEAAPEDPDATVTHELVRLPVFAAARTPAEDEGTTEEVQALPGDREPPFQPPRSLGGYRVGRALGPTRAGALFEARRRATGRALGLAVVKPRWSAQAGFVARFAREAYAAGQLSHPNLIAPSDLDIIKGFPFVASDSRDGSPLSDPSARSGLDRSARVSAVLHAARALRHAHEQGVYHRDLSLSKIRVDGSGLVRLADVGSGLTPDAPETSAVAPIPLAGSPGSPQPPAPEPPSAAFVREDVKALGRALQSLVGGSLGDRAMTPGLAEVVRKMTEAGPEPRFPDLGAAVRALETELGVGGAYLPREGEAAAFEAAARDFDAPPLARARPLLAGASTAALGLFGAIALWRGRPLPALGAVAFGAIALAALVAFRGPSRRNPLFDRGRELILGGPRGDVLAAAAAAVLAVLTLALTGLLGLWTVLGLVAVGLAAAYHFALERPLEQARAEALGRGVALVRGARQLGVVEDAVRRFACRQGGRGWEEFFEALFGYDALRYARRRWGGDAGGKSRPRFARWRDPIVDAIDRRIGARSRDRDRLLFAGIEERSLEARGVNLLTARRKSRRIAEAIVLFARQYKGLDEPSLGMPLSEILNRVAEKPDDYLPAEEAEAEGPPAWRVALGALAGTLLGPRARFLAGSVLLAGCLAWMHQNALLESEEFRRAGAEVTADPGKGFDRDKALDAAGKLTKKLADNVRGVANADTPTRHLEIQGLSPDVARRLDGFGLGVAGLILVLSSAFRGARFAAFAVPGALVAALGPHLIEPGARTLGTTSLIALAAGAGLFGLGLMFGRTRE